MRAKRKTILWMGETILGTVKRFLNGSVTFSRLHDSLRHQRMFASRVEIANWNTRRIDLQWSEWRKGRRWWSEQLEEIWWKGRRLKLQMKRTLDKISSKFGMGGGMKEIREENGRRTTDEEENSSDSPVRKSLSNHTVESMKRNGWEKSLSCSFNFSFLRFLTYFYCTEILKPWNLIIIQKMISEWHDNSETIRWVTVRENGHLEENEEHAECGWGHPRIRFFILLR